MNEGRPFAGFNSEFERSAYIIAGIPFDKTSSFRTGSWKGPDEIRDASYCFEPYLMEQGVLLDDIDLCDIGNISNLDDFEQFSEDIEKLGSDIVKEEKFPIFLGGEHSISAPIVSSLKNKHPDLNVVIMDAHLDFRDSYEGLEHSHASVTRRITESVGLENVLVLGIRSMASSTRNIEKPHFLTSKRTEEEIQEKGDISKIIFDNIQGPTYLSVDMDVVDPAFAPGVGNPEPFGLFPRTLKELLSVLAPSLVGMDIVEVNPKYDHGGITSNLAARLIYELIGEREKKKEIR